MPIRGSSSIALRPKQHRRRWKKQKPPRLRPFVREVDPQHREWKVFDSYVGSTDKHNLTMTVPTDMGVRSGSVRLHEQLHNRFSPEPDWVKECVTDQGVDDRCYQIAEDVRLAKCADSRGLEQEAVIDNESLIRGARNSVHTKSETPVIDSVKLALSLTGQGDSRGKYLNALRGEDRVFYKKVNDMVDGVDQYMGREFADDGSSVNVARYLMQLQDKEREEEKQRKKIEEELRKMANSYKESKTSAGEESAMSREEAIRQAMKHCPNIEDLSPGTTPPMLDDEMLPGVMKVRVPPMPRRVYPKNREGRVLLSKDYGTVPNRIHNWCISKRIFTKTVKFTPGATVLIDASGSMRSFINPETVQQIINIAPGSKIAMYSGNGRSGDLVILADHGRAATQEGYRQFWHGGNVIDLPAVDWLSKEKGPRYWVTDLGVTGVGDAGSNVILAACLTICVKGRIKIVGTPGKLYEAMKLTQAVSDEVEETEEF